MQLLGAGRHAVVRPAAVAQHLMPARHNVLDTNAEADAALVWLAVGR